MVTIAAFSSTLSDALARIEDHAPFLKVLVVHHPSVVDIVAQGRVRDLLAAPSDESSTVEIGKNLRYMRQRVALGAALADLSGMSDLGETVRLLSDFADYALDAAIKAAMAEVFPGTAPTGFVALALGKLGSRELNYSSDIDPILVFDPITFPRHQRLEPVEAAARVARRVVQLLEERNADGYVLRVDLRLRPSPEATPPALPFEAALGYYESSALPWERAAFVPCTSCAGDIALGESFLSAIRPFIWRRTLDYGNDPRDPLDLAADS